MQFIKKHYILLFNALCLIVNHLICPCKSNRRCRRRSWTTMATGDDNDDDDDGDGAAGNEVDDDGKDDDYGDGQLRQQQWQQRDRRRCNRI